VQYPAARHQRLRFLKLEKVGQAPAQRWPSSPDGLAFSAHRLPRQNATKKKSVDAVTATTAPAIRSTRRTLVTSKRASGVGVSVLLRKADGLKSFMPRPVLVEANDLPIADAPDLEEAFRDFGLRSSVAALHPYHSHHIATCVDELLQLDVNPPRMKSTFSCDIAYSDRPAASRAWVWSVNQANRIALPFRIVRTWPKCWSSGAPLPRPCP
jgi:hypothetical protein